MYRRISYLNLITIILLFSVLLGLNYHVSAQNNFSLGMFGYDQPFPGHAFNTNEQNLLLGLNSNFIFGVLDTSHYDDIINFGNTNDFSMGLECDPTSDPITGPFYPCDTGLHNTALWPYICRNVVADIDSIEIEQFINNVYSEYPNDAGLSAILVAHQGDTDEPDHWPYIQYACSLINVNYGDDVESIAIWNVFQWDPGGQAGLENFFRTVDSLDVYHHEFYPFHVGGQYSYPPNDSSVFVGNEFQTDYIDNNIINSYQQTQQALENSGNTHTRWEVIMQTQRSWSASSGHFWRRPNQSEVWLQAFLAISRGAKGVHAYLYHSYQTSSSRAYGLVDRSATRQPINTPNYNQPYNNVAQLYEHLSELGPYLLPLSVDTAFTWTGTSTDYIQNITGDSLDGTHRTIEVSIFYEYNSNDYFMLINRRCNRDSANVWVNAYPQHISLTIDPDVAGTYQIRDLYSNEHYVTSDNTFRNIEILAGRGRVFELRRIFTQDETWANTINICSDITVPSGRTLTISPNSTIKFHSGTELKFNGHLNAKGTSSQHITFTSVSSNPNKGSWDYIRIDNSSGNDTLIYCDIKYANIAVWGMTNSQIYLNHVSVDSSLNYGLYLLNNDTRTTVDSSYFTNSSRGIFLINSSPYLVNVNCTDNNEGIFCYNGSSPEIGYSIISSNSLDGMVCLKESLPWIYHQTSFMRGNNWIRYNGSEGVYSDSSSFPKMGFNSIYPGNNVIEFNNGYEIYNGHPSRSLWVVYNWWQDNLEPDSSDLHTAETIIYKPINPNPRPGSSLLAATSNLIMNMADVVNNSLSDPEYYNEIGTKYLIEGKYNAAIEAFQYVIDEYPEIADAIYALVQMPYCYEGLNKKDDIVSYLEQISDRNTGKNHLEYFSLSLSVSYLEREGNYLKAVERCEQVIKKLQAGDINKNLLFIMANIYYYGLNDNEKAKTYFEEYLDTYPKDPMANTARFMLELLESGSLAKRNISNDSSDETIKPGKFALYQNYPNPFNPETQIQYQLPEDCFVTLTIYNILGQKIRTLVNFKQQTGYHTVRWDGKDDQGAMAASGLYLYQLNADRFNKVKKMLLLR